MTAPRPTGAEAGLLLHALCERIACDTGTRVLAIKGPVVALHGLRAPRVSADIDVLVHPDDLARFVDGMRAAGWYDAVETTSPRLAPAHSVNLLHAHWPVGIDVHHYFPGFLAPPADVFEALWARRRTLELASAPVTACDPVAMTAVVGLHLLRHDAEGHGEGVHDLVDRARARLGPTGVQELADLARETDCTVPLRPILVALGAKDLLGEAEHSQALSSWFDRARPVPGMEWGRQLRLSPWWRWPSVLWRSVWLTDEEIAAHHGGDQTRGSHLRARLRRLRKVTRLFPGIVRGVLRRPPRPHGS